MKRLWLLFSGLVLLAVSFFFDKSVILLFVSLRNPYFDYIALFFSYTYIQLSVFFVLPLLILWFKNRNSAFLFFLSFFIVAIFTYSLKVLVLRPRPFLALGIPLIAYISYEFAWFNASFPSSHASTSFSSFAALEKFSSLKWFWLFLCLVVSLSRIYDGVHYLSDIIFGSLLGYFVTYSVFLLDKKYRFSEIWKKMV